MFVLLMDGSGRERIESEAGAGRHPGGVMG